MVDAGSRRSSLPLVFVTTAALAVSACGDRAGDALAPAGLSLAQDTLGGACTVSLFWHSVEYRETSLDHQDLLGNLGDDWRFHAEASLQGETFTSDFPAPGAAPLALSQGMSLTLFEKLADRTFEEGTHVTVIGRGEAREVDHPPSGKLDDLSVIVGAGEEGGTKLEFDCVEEGEEFIEVTLAVIPDAGGKKPPREFAVLSRARGGAAGDAGAALAKKPKKPKKSTDDVDDTALVIFFYFVRWSVTV